MNKDELLNLLEKDKLNIDEYKEISNYFKIHYYADDFELLTKFYSKFSNMLPQKIYSDQIIICTAFLRNPLSDQVKGTLLNYKTYFSLANENKYSALEAAYSFRSLSDTRFLDRALNCNLLSSILYLEGLYVEALEVILKFLEDSKNIPEFTDEIKISSYVNLTLIYAHLDEYDKYKSALAESDRLIKKCKLVIYCASFTMTKISCECILYKKHREDIDINKNFVEYKNFLVTYLKRREYITDTIDTHVDIINCMVDFKQYKDAENVCLMLLSLVTSLSDKIELYKMLKKIYTITNNKKVYEIMPLYISCVEEIKNNDHVFYRQYAKFSKELSDLSSKYFTLLKDYKTDSLTKCYSRNALNELERSNAIIEGYLIYLDLNNLKSVNDSYGHKYGDEYLVKFANLLIECVKHSEIYRIGGDEFVAICHTNNLEDVKKYLDILNEKTQILREENNFNMNFKFSAGIVKTDGKRTLTEFIDLADKAMYYCKKNKNGYYHVG